ncbi:MAG: LPS export ABC transporter periplasmic protein LptC [Acidobacteria bacterium]|nr:LPS export ABC transporter periplasmic protein LptC [Acidobacteriota bacterium]
MSPTEQRAKNFAWKAKAPAIVRAIVLVALAALVFGIIAAYFNSRSKPQFTLRPEEARLSKELTAEVANYQRTETKDGLPLYSVKADIAKTFADEHQELENVEFRLYGKEGEVSETLTAGRVIYIPKPEKDFTAFLRENVVIKARDGLEVRTESIAYERSSNTAESDAPVQFNRGNLTGQSEKATLNLTAETLDLIGTVEFDIDGTGGVRTASIRAGSAVFDRPQAMATFANFVNVNAVSANKSTTELSAPRVIAFMNAVDGEKVTPKSFKAFEGVNIVSKTTTSGSSTVSATEAAFDVAEDKFELNGNVRIETGPNASRANITAANALYFRNAGEFTLTDTQIVRPAERIAGDKLDGKLYADNSIRDVVVRGNAIAKQETTERIVEIAGGEMNASFSQGGSIANANAVSDVKLVVVPNKAVSYSRATLTAQKGVGVNFRGNGDIDKARADGRAKLVLDPPSGSPDAAVRTISAETLRTAFRPNGKDIASAEAVGSANLTVDPVSSGLNIYRTVVNAPRMDCEFYSSGNNARLCTAATKAAVVRSPKFSAPSRGEQKMNADRFIARFEESTGQLERIEASGSARFVELDRNATAREFSFTQSDQVVRLRGGEPTVWDSRARARAGEIDWDTKGNRSYLRGRVSTTFYNVRNFGNSAPFTSGNDPVFLTSERAEFDHANESGLYTGNARAWQQSNYVRADSLFIDQKNGQMKGEGGVQSQLSRTRIRRGSSDVTVPVVASAKGIFYDRYERILKYRENVDIRQGTDRITASVVDVLLTESGDVAQTVAENSVNITQPGRRASGDWAQYTAADESVVLRGRPAVVSDSEAGSTQGSQISYSMRDRRAVSNGRTDAGGNGRSRTVYPVKPGE